MADTTTKREMRVLTQEQIDQEGLELGRKFADVCHGHSVDGIAEAVFRLLHSDRELKRAWMNLLIAEASGPPRERYCECAKCQAERAGVNAPGGDA